MTEGVTTQGDGGMGAATGLTDLANPITAAMIEAQLVGHTLDTLTVGIGRLHSLVAFVPESQRGPFESIYRNLRSSGASVVAMLSEES
jgi:hypothetical protein